MVHATLPGSDVLLTRRPTGHAYTSLLNAKKTVLSAEDRVLFRKPDFFNQVRPRFFQTFKIAENT